MERKKTLIGNKPLFFKLDQVEGHDINTKYQLSLQNFV